MTALAAVPRETSDAIARLEEIPLDLVDIGANVRDDAGDLAELAASIAELGVLEPVKVTEQPDGRYRLVWGQRRVLAAKLAERTTILAIVEPPAADVDEAGARRSIEQLAENLQRQDLNPIEEAVALRDVLDGTKGLTQDALAKRLGVSAPWVSNALTLLDSPAAVQEHVRAGRLTPSHVKAMRGQAAKTQLELAKDAIDRGLSAHGLEERVQQLKRSEEWDRERRQRDTESRKAAKDRRDAGIAKLVAAAALDVPIRIVSYGSNDGLTNAIAAAGFTDVATVSYYGGTGVAKRSETGCDCIAWRVEEQYSGHLSVTEACIVESHQQAVLANSRAGEEAKRQLIASCQSAVKEQLQASIAVLPRTVRQALLWHAMDYTALEWLKAKRKATKERKLDPWVAMSRLPDSELDELLADHASRQFHDRYGLHIDWPTVATDLAIDPAKPPKPAFTDAQVAAARAELDLDGD